MTPSPEPDGWRRYEFIDFPTAWWIAGEIEHTDPRCSCAQTGGALLCDCNALHVEWARRRGAVHDWTELDALIKRHHDTGEHGGCHLAMPQTLWGAVRARNLPRPEPRPVVGARPRPVDGAAGGARQRHPAQRVAPARQRDARGRPVRRDTEPS